MKEYYKELINITTKEANELQSILRADVLAESNRHYNLEPVRTEPKIGRNEPCKCGSGKKYKKCCLPKT